MLNPHPNFFRQKTCYRFCPDKSERVLSDHVAIRIGRSRSPSSMYDTGDLPYEREEADGTRLRRMREQEHCRRKRPQMRSVLSSISLHLFVARTVYGETARLQPDFVRSKIRRIPSPPCLERSINLPLRFAFFDGLALVPCLFMARKPDQYLHAIVRSIHPKRHDCQTALAGFSDQFPDLSAVEQQAARALRVVRCGRVLWLIRRDCGVEQPCLVVFDDHKRAGQPHPPGLDRLDLKSRQYQPGLVCLENMIIE